MDSNSTKLKSQQPFHICGNLQADYKIYMKHNGKNSQDNTKEEQSWKTYSPGYHYVPKDNV